MRNLRTVTPTLLTGLTVGVLAFATLNASVVRQEPPANAGQEFATFNQRVDAYVTLHRTLAASLPPLGGRDRHSVTIGRHYLASAIKAARAKAHQGDIFGSEAVVAFRRVINDTTRAADFGMLAPLMDENGRLLPGLHPAMHEPIPLLESRELPPLMLAGLPRLPEELEYRFVDYDLVLWDVYADLVVDVMPYALTYPRSDLMYR